MAAQVIPMFGNEALGDGQEDWKDRFLAFVSVLLEEFLEGLGMGKLSDITSKLFNHKAEILGQMVLAFITAKVKNPEYSTQIVCRWRSVRYVERICATMEDTRTR